MSVTCKTLVDEIFLTGILTFMSCHVSCRSLEEFVIGKHMFMCGREQINDSDVVGA